MVNLTITKGELKDLVQACDFAVSAVELGEVKTTYTKWHALRDKLKEELEGLYTTVAQEPKTEKKMEMREAYARIIETEEE